MSRRKIGIFGGTFNPVHIGHLRIAEEVGEMLGLDLVLFLPSFDPPFRKSGLVSFRHRLAMVRLATAGNPLFGVSDIESKCPGKSYTARTLELLREKHGGDRLMFIMGSDTFLDMPRWYRPEKVLEAVDLVVIPRPPAGIVHLAGSPLLDREQKDKIMALSGRKKISLSMRGGRKIIVAAVTPLHISATVIRGLIRQGRSVKYLLPQKVESYIISNRLYG